MSDARSWSCVFLLSLGCVAGGQTADSDAQESTEPRVDARVQSDAAIVPIHMYVHSADTLYIVDDQNFSLTQIGSFGGDKSMMDLAVTQSGDLYTISFESVFLVDPSTGEASPKADVPYGNVGMTFLPDGTLLAADNEGGVRVIDPTTGNVTELGSFGNGYALAGDLVAVADGTMYAIADEGPEGTEATSNVLLQVDTTNGAATAVGPIGFSGGFGVAVANEQVYAFTRDGEIVEIDPHSGAGTLVASYPEISFWGAGVTPRAIID